MVSFKLVGVKSKEVKSGFESYDGPTPTATGFYRAKIAKMEFRSNNSGSKGFWILAELEAEKGDPKNHAKFDGFPLFISSIITETADGSPLKEGSEANLSNLMFALGVPDEPTVVTAPGKKEGNLVITKIGGKNPIGTVVNIDLGMEAYGDGTRPSSNGVFKFNGGVGGEATPVDEEPEDEDIEEEIDEEVDADGDPADDEYTEREAELNADTLPNLRTIAKPLGVKTPGLKKPELVQAILDAEFESIPEGDEEEPEEDEEEVEVEEDEEEAEEEEEEAEEEDPEAERAAELATFDRPALKAALKEVVPTAKVFKSTTDEDLVAQILAAEFGETPF